MKPFFVVAVLLAGIRPAFADDVQAAKQHYEQGTTYYDLGRFVDAAHEYEAAFEAKHDPALLFNIGQCYRFAGDYGKAIISFRAYLRRLPNAENRAEVEARIGEMQRLLDEQRKTQEKPPAGTLTPHAATGSETTAERVPPTNGAAVAPASAQETPHANRTMLFAGIGVGAGGIAVAGGGLALLLIAKSAADGLNHPAQGTPYDSAADSRMRAENAAGITLISVGAAAVVAGVTLAVLGRRSARQQHASLVPTFGRQFAGAAFESTY